MELVLDFEAVGEGADGAGSVAGFSDGLALVLLVVDPVEVGLYSCLILIGAI